MPNFAYWRHRSGERVKGAAQATSSSSGADLILGPGMTPGEISESDVRPEEVFRNVFNYIEFDQLMREQANSALRYPGFVVGAMMTAIAVFSIFVIPVFAKVFTGFGAELPLMTRILLGFSNFMVAWWPAMAIGLVAVFTAFRTCTDTQGGRMQWDRIKLSIPIAGKIVHKALAGRIARSFAVAAKSGVPIMQAMSVVARTIDNSYIAQQLEKMREGVERGDGILRAAIASRIFTPLGLQMIAVGNDCGAIDEMMERIAEVYQREVDYQLKILQEQIEPILIVFLGILVLLLALGMFLPVWDLGRSATGLRG